MKTLVKVLLYEAFKNYVAAGNALATFTPIKLFVFNVKAMNFLL